MIPVADTANLRQSEREDVRIQTHDLAQFRCALPANVGDAVHGKSFERIDASGWVLKLDTGKGNAHVLHDAVVDSNVRFGRHAHPFGTWHRGLEQ